MRVRNRMNEANPGVDGPLGEEQANVLEVFVGFLIDPCIRIEVAVM